MNWLNIHTDILRSEVYLGADPIERATWLNLMGWGATQEIGGVIKGAQEWKDRKWQQLCGVTKTEVDTDSGLYGFEGGNLMVYFYPVEKEAEVRAKRQAGKKGGRPRKPLKNKGEKPHGYENENHEVQLSKREVITEGNGREGKGNDNKKTSPEGDDDIEKVWKAYPNKKGKKNAVKGIAKALKTHTPEELIKRIHSYAKATEPKYYKHGSTYFTGEHYEDELQPLKAESKYGTMI